MLILLSIAWIWVIGYLYFFVYHVVVITVQNNIADYSVVLESKNSLEKQIIRCPEKTCAIPNIPPLEYIIGIGKQWYNPQIFEKQVTSSLTLDIVMLPEVNFEVIPEKITHTQNAILAWSDRVHTTSYLFQDNAIADTIYNTVQDIDIQIPIKYVKTGFNEREFLIVTEKGTFQFDTQSGTSTYFTLFLDFVYFEDSYIWVVHPDDTRIRNNLQLSGDDTLLVRYSPKTKTHIIYHSFGLGIEKIYIQDESIIILDDTGESYSLK